MKTKAANVTSNIKSGIVLKFSGRIATLKPEHPFPQALALFTHCKPSVLPADFMHSVQRRNDKKNGEGKRVLAYALPEQTSLQPV